MKKKNSISNDILFSITKIFSSSILNTIAVFFRSYFVARFLGPTLQGTWSIAKISIQYSSLSSLSLPAVAQRNIPQLIGEERKNDAENLAALVFTFSIISAIIFAIGVFIFSFSFTDENLSISLKAASIIIIATAFNGYGNIISNARNKYSLTSKVMLLQGILNFISIAIIYHYYFKGLLVSLIIINIIVSIAYYKILPYGYFWFWDKALLKKIILDTMPIFFVTTSTILFSSVDRLMIAGFLTLKEVGFYSLGAIFTAPLIILLKNLSTVIFTHLNEKYGQNQSNKILEKYLNKPYEYTRILMPAILFIIILYMPFVVKMFLPKYEQGIVAAQILIFGLYFNSTSLFSSNAIFKLNKQKITAIYFLLIGIFKIILSFVFLNFKFGIIGIAAATTISYFLYNGGLITVSYNLIGYSLIKTLKKVFYVLYPSILFFISFVLLNFILSEYGIFTKIVYLVLIVGTTFPSFFIFKYSKIIFSMVK